jgi:high-affinity Fe2+/Pb2+ permease
MAITFAFVGYNHDYDYVALIPILTSLWYYAARRPVYWTVVAPLVILFFFPQRYVRLAGIPALDQWRTIVVMLFLWAVLYFSCRTRGEANPAVTEKSV